MGFWQCVSLVPSTIGELNNVQFFVQLSNIVQYNAVIFYELYELVKS